MKIGQPMIEWARKGRRTVLGAIFEEERLEGMVGPPGIWKERRQFQYDFLREMGLQPHHTLLEIGCGPLSAGIPLIGYLQKGHYVGVDIRPKVINEAYIQLAKQDLALKNPVLAVSTSFGGDELESRQFDYVWSYSVLYHLDDESADACFQEVSRRMNSDSKYLVNVNVLQSSGHWDEFVFVKRELVFYETLGSKYGMDMEVLGQLVDLGYAGNDNGRLNHMLSFRKHAD